MNPFFRIISHSLAFFMFFTSSDQACAAFLSSSNSKCNITSGNVVCVWLAQDQDGDNKKVIQASVGLISSDPSTWKITNLSDSTLKTVQVFNPLLFTNAKGDALVVWQYGDDNGNFQVAASALPSGTSDWSSATISDLTQSAGNFDQLASIDESGNVLVTWTAYNSDLGINQVMGATSVMGQKLSWSFPFAISQ